ncbi:MAG: hypothetical protein LQ350_006079 [Teloschistes chrysophthalmus]|nr:MAG: hypothetical protein LQ350_006079 [Niorma chrysophthalma]
MIERAATCLENGGKHILHIPKKPFRKYRSLHSAFWSHGAGDINLPAWWHAFLQVPSHSNHFWPSKDSAVPLREKASDNASLRFLDFLYPSQTLAFIHKCVSENTATLRRRRRLQILSQRSRAYTSSADTSADEPSNKDIAADNSSAPSAPEDGTSGAVTEEAVPDPRVKLHELLFSEDESTTMHQLWRMYQQTQELSLSLDPGDLDTLFKKLNASQWTIDLERTRELLDSVAPSSRRASHYTCAISASLKLDEFKRAMDIHQEAALRVRGSFGSSLVFLYAMLHSHWHAATAIWQQFEDSKEVYFGPQDIWDGFDALTLTDRMKRAQGALQFAQYTMSPTKDSIVVNTTRARHLAWSLVQRTLQVRRTNFELSSQKLLLAEAQRIERPGFLLYKNAIIQNFDVAKSENSLAHREWGFHLYHMLRTELNMLPDAELIKVFLRTSYFVDNLEGMYEALEDYRKSPEGINPWAYQTLMSGFARHGDFDTVNQLFQEATNRFGTEDVPIYARELLNACFRRAEIDRAIGIAEWLQEKYNYLPDLQAWHTLLRTYSRVGDCDGAMALFEKLVESNIRPDGSTYAILMNMFARVGDYDATSILYERAMSEGIEMNADMVTCLVLAQTRSGRSDEAAETVEEALKMGLGVDEHSAAHLSGDYTRTRMWNALLEHYAMEGHLDRVSETTKRMQSNKVAFDGYTYAALMRAFIIKDKQMIQYADKILKDVMPKAQVPATALHYGILMSAYQGARNYKAVFFLYQRMLALGVKSTFSVQLPFMKAAAEIDEREREQEREQLDQHAEGDVAETRAEKILTQTLDSLDSMELAGLGLYKGKQSNPVNVALYASYFPFLIQLYGRRKCFEKVAALYDKFIATTRERKPHLEANPPVELSSALMVAYTEAGEHEETERCWKLAFEKATEIACKADADTTQPGWVLYKYRFLLALPLTRYMISLQAMSRVDEIEPLWASLEQAGFQLSSPNRNKYIQILAEEGRGLQAFELCERELMDGWPGWAALGKPRKMKRRLNTQWNPKSWEIGRRFPQYTTLVHLAGLYLDAQSMAYGRGTKLLKEYDGVAPRVVDAIVKMPEFSDPIQTRILKR